MKKILSCIIILVSLAYSGTSPFSSVRAVYSDDNIVPIEEIIDLTVCLERKPVVENIAMGCPLLLISKFTPKKIPFEVIISCFVK